MGGVLSLPLAAEVTAGRAYLFSTPPRTEHVPDQSLVQAGLVPAASVVLAFRLPPPLVSRPALNAEEILSAHALSHLSATAEAAAALPSLFPESRASQAGLQAGLQAAELELAHSSNLSSTSRITSGAPPAADAEGQGGASGGVGASLGGGEAGAKCKPAWLKL